jgi:hypothetical protein
MDKALKQPTTPTKHAQTHTSIIKQSMINATLLLTQVTPNDCEIQRGKWLSMGDSSSKPWTVEVANQLSVSDA